MWRWMKLLSPFMLLGYSGCLPTDYLPNLLGSSITAVTSVLLSDAMNLLVPAT